MSAEGRGRLTVAAISLLVLGAAAGVAIDRLVLLHRPHIMRVEFQSMREPAFAVLDSVLDLRPDQRAHFEAVLDAHQPAMNQVWRDTHLRLVGILDSTVAELTSVLDAEQTERLHALVRQLHGDAPASSLHR